MKREPSPPIPHDRTPPEATAPETAATEAAPADPAPGRRPRRPRLRRRLAAGLAGVLALAVGGTAGLLWFAAGRLVRPMDDTPLNTYIVASAPGTVTLPATADSRYPGTFGLIWQDKETDRRHHGTLGPVLASDDDTVTRELTADTLPAPRAEAKVIVTVWNSDPGRALGLDHQDVTYPGELGPMPAWFLPGTGTTWVIQVHGLGAGRAAGLRTMSQLHDLGHPVLDITYRNDPGAPRDSSNTRHFGDTEWRDLDAVVLDSPALDYRATLDTIVGGLGLPAPVAALQAGILGLRSDVDLDDIDALAANRRTGGPQQPVLLFHGTGDTVVPYATSAEFARDWPDKVRLVTVEGASHTGAWNADPIAYAEELAAFLARHT
ncbi:alpha/beta hydrolase [Streptomyces microflavus]|uniref:alpha/beta hydrolase n=1 Tax=Streptomyces microflavus TaxID=1919 RepID=UPI00369CA1F6